MNRCVDLSVEELMGCCSSSKFASQLKKVLPLSSVAQVIEASRTVWWNQVDIPGWLEAFEAHPRIGDINALRIKFSKSKWCQEEQSAALNTADEDTLQELVEWNKNYEGKFGFIFLICATGKSSSDILESIKVRCSNRPIVELQAAAAEQQKITELRLIKLLANSSSACSGSHPRTQSIEASSVSSDEKLKSLIEGQVTDKKVEPTHSEAPLRPPITTHVLDVSLGQPGSGIHVTLEGWRASESSLEDLVSANGKWTVIGSSVTNDDGRSGPLMGTSNHIQAGKYRLTFNTEDYFKRTQSFTKGEVEGSGFYPYVSVVFSVNPTQVLEHFHVPVLLSPFSYTTYRGS